MTWQPRPGGRDAAPQALPEERFRTLLAEDPDSAWRAFVDCYTPALLALIERAGVADRDEAMEIYVLACERLSADNCATLRRRDPAKGSLEGWLAVIVRRAVVDWIRSRAGRRRLFAAVRHLDPFHQRLFELYYWEGRRPAEAAQILTVETQKDVSLSAVLDALATIDNVLTNRHRSDLLSLALRSQSPVSLDERTATDGIDAPATTPDPEAALAGQQMEDRLTRALAGLPAEDAAIVALKYGEGLTRPQIQRLLRLPELTEHRVRSILAALRARLAPEGRVTDAIRSAHALPRRQDA